MADKAFDPSGMDYNARRKMSAVQIEEAVRKGSVVSIQGGQKEALAIAQQSGWEIDALITELENERKEANRPRGIFDIEFKNPKVFTWLLVAFASMGGLLSGCDQSLISGANLFLPDDLGLSVRQNSLVNSAMPLGAIGGAIILSPSNEYFGRRWSIIISCILYTIGAALEAGAQNYGMIVGSRVILGLGVGLEGGTVPIYVAETVERRLRGNLVSLYQFAIALGEVLGYAIAAIFLHVDGNWRWILGSSVLFSTGMLIGMLFMPESPRWLMYKGRTIEAFDVWRRIRGIDTADSREEFFVMKVTLDQEESAIKAGRGSKRFPWMDLFTNPRARRAFVVANMMIFLGQFTGINAVMYYMSTLMNQIGFDKIKANYMSLVGGASLLLGTLPAIFYMEKFGRRFWANTMLPGFFVGLLLVGISYEISFNNLAAVQGVYLTGLILYEGFFGSYATLTWVVPSEVYPTYLRSYGMTTSDAFLFLSSFIVTYNFSAMETAMTRIGLTLGFYGGIAVLGFVYQVLFLPETKDKTLEEIDLIFERPTMDIVRENIANTKRTTKALLGFRFKEAFDFQPRRKSLSDVPRGKPEQL